MFWCKGTEKKFICHISLESCGFRGNKSTLRDWLFLQFFAAYRYPDSSPVSRFKN